MIDRVFFYGTLMAAYRRPRRLPIDPRLHPEGAGSIQAALFDLGSYPGAVPAGGARVVGEVFRLSDPRLLGDLDEFEQFFPHQPDASLYRRDEVTVTFDDGRESQAWAYFYNASLENAVPIESGDYLEYLKDVDRKSGRAEREVRAR